MYVVAHARVYREPNLQMKRQCLSPNMQSSCMAAVLAVSMVRPGLFQKLHTDPSHLKACFLGLTAFQYMVKYKL